MNKQTLQNILVFLGRVDLKGNEAVSLVQAQQAISLELKKFPDEPKEEKVETEKKK